LDNDVSVKFTADASDLSRGAQQAQQAVENVGRSASDVAKQFGKLTPEIKASIDKVGDAAWNFGPWSGSQVQMAQFGVQGLVAAFGAVGASGVAAATLIGAAFTAILHHVTSSVVDLGVEMDKLANNFNQSLGGMGGLASFSVRAGADTKDVATAFGKLQKNANDGDDDTEKALKAIGLRMDEIKGKNFNQLLETFARTFSGTADSANKLAAANALLGEDLASKLLPELNRGVDHVRDMEAAATRAGVSLDQGMRVKILGTNESIQRVKDATHELSMAFSGVSVTIYSIFKPAIDGVIEGFGDLIRNIASGVEWLNQAARTSGAFHEAMNLLAGAVKVVVTAIGLLIDAIEALVALGVGSASIISDAFHGMANVIAAVFLDIAVNGQAAFTGLANAASAVTTSIGKMFDDVGGVIKNALSGDVSGASAAYGQLKDHAASAAAGISSAFSDMPGMKNTDRAVQDMGARLKKDYADTASGVVEVAKQTVAQLKTIWGDGASKPQASGLKNASAIPKDGSGGKADTAQQQADIKAIEDQIRAVQTTERAKAALYADAVRIYQMTEEQKVAATRVAANEAYQAQRALLEKEAQIAGLSLAQKQSVEDKKKALDIKYAAESQRLAIQAAEASMRPWTQMVDAMSSSMSSGIMGMIRGTQNFRQVLGSLTSAIIQSFVNMGVQMVANWAKQELFSLALHQTTEGAKTAASITGAAARSGVAAGEASAVSLPVIGAAIRSITASAAETFAGVFGFLSPVMGPAAAAPAAAAQSTVAAVAAFDVGAWSINQDQLAMVHKGEMVMTAGQSKGLRSVINAAQSAYGGAGGSARSGDTYNGDIHVHATTAGIEDLVNANPKGFVNAMRRLQRHGHLKFA